jgi:hypothetical protein
MVRRRPVLEMRARRQHRRLERACIDPAADEEGQALLDAAHAERFHPFDIEAAPQDQLGRTAADIHHQPPLIGLAEGVRHAHIDQAPLFLARNDLDRITDGLLQLGQEIGGIARLAQDGGGDHAHAVELVGGQRHAEILQAKQRALQCFVGEVAGGVQAGGQADRLAHAIEHADLVSIVVSDGEPKTVGAQVHCGVHRGIHLYRL